MSGMVPSRRHFYRLGCFRRLLASGSLCLLFGFLFYAEDFSFHDLKLPSFHGLNASKADITHQRTDLFQLAERDVSRKETELALKLRPTVDHFAVMKDRHGSRGS